MINSISRYFRPNTASVLSQITSMVDKLDKVNEQHTAIGIKFDAAANAAVEKAHAAYVEAGVANTAAKKIKAAFGL